MPTIQKPCIRKCCLNDKDICMGCFRSFEDMKIWRSATADEKLEILRRAKLREKRCVAVANTYCIVHKK